MSGAQVDVENLRSNAPFWILVHSLHLREHVALAFSLMMFIALEYWWSLVTNLASRGSVGCSTFDDTANYFEFDRIGSLHNQWTAFQEDVRREFETRKPRLWMAQRGRCGLLDAIPARSAASQIQLSPAEFTRCINRLS